MRKQIVTPQDLDRLPIVDVVYTPRNFRTVAVQVTVETIGAMAIEFGGEVQANGPKSWFLPVLLGRTNGKGEQVADNRVLHMGDWLVAFDNEVHVYPGDVFQYTFGQAFENLHLNNAPDPGEPAQPATTFMTLPADLQHQELPPLPPEVG